MAYVEGMVAPIRAGARDAFYAQSVSTGQVLLDHGAVEVVDCLGDDVPHGQVTDFYRAVAAEADEVVGFSWIVWPSKEARAAGWAAAMADPRMQQADSLPFDPRRMIFGGFEVVYDSRATA